VARRTPPPGSFSGGDRLERSFQTTRNRSSNQRDASNRECVVLPLYFQRPGVAEAELERDVRDTIRRIFLGEGAPGGMLPRNGGWLTGRVAPHSFPSWLTEADVEFYATEFARTGFRGGLNWYRNLD